MLRLLIILTLTSFVVFSDGRARSAETLSIYAELAPPFIKEDGSGLTQQLFKRIAADGDYAFDWRIVPSFSRAWMHVASGQGDVVMHVILDRETEKFNKDMIQSSWFLPVQPALFYKDESVYERFAQSQSQLVDNPPSVGLPFGNAHYGVASLGLPKVNFTEANIDSLVQMLDRDRIDAIWCMKLNVRTALERHKILGVKSRDYPANYQIKLGAGFQKTDRGRKLKTALDSAVAKLNLEKIMPDVFRLSMPDS